MSIKQTFGRSLRIGLVTLVTAMTLLVCGSPAANAGSLTLFDPWQSITYSNIANTQGQMSESGGLLDYTITNPSLFTGGFSGGTRGILGVNNSGGLSFATTDIVGSSQVGSTVNFGLAPSSGLAYASGWFWGVNAQGGVNLLDSLLGGATINLAGTSGLLSTSGGLIPYSLAGAWKDNFNVGSNLSFAADTSAMGVLGVNNNGGVTFIRIDGPSGLAGQVGSTRNLGFDPNSGLALLNGAFIAGVNTAGGLNLYMPDFDILYEDVGGAGLFSNSGGLLDYVLVGGSTGFPGLNPNTGMEGILGISPLGGLSFLPLTDAFNPKTAMGFTSTPLGFAASSGIAENAMVGGIAPDANSVPEAPTSLLVVLGMLILFWSAYMRRTARQKGIGEVWP